jgi:cobalamin transport system substrate-binding protein
MTRRRLPEQTRRNGRRLLLAAVTLLASAVVLLRAQPSQAPTRIVSLIPAVTEMLFAMGDGARLVGVSNYDRFPREVERIQKVGGLLDPDVERIIALKPDLVIVYATQAELTQRLDRARIPYYLYEHRGLPDIMETVRAIGARIGAPAHGRTLAAQMDADLAAVRASVATLPRPKTLLVFGRDPQALRNMQASGGYGFLHDVLGVAGGDNVFADIRKQSVEVSTEVILARRPEAIVDLWYGDSARTLDVAREQRVWDALASVPAVRNKQVHVLVGDDFVSPGPRVVDAARKLARAIHPALAR